MRGSAPGGPSDAFDDALVGKAHRVTLSLVRQHGQAVSKGYGISLALF
jgi:hypothetical protein